MATVTGSKRHLDITSDTLTTSSNVDVGAKLFITTTDTNTTSTSALVLNSTEVETRTLGSLAFSSATYDNYVSWNLKTNDTQRTTVGSGGDLNIVAGTNVGVAYSAGGTVTISSTDTTYSAGTLLDLSSTTFNVDLTELSNNTATFAPTQDHFVILDNGVQGKKLASSIFGSAAYEASSAFATASHTHGGVYVPEYEALQPSGSDREMNVWRKTHAVYSDDGSAATYFVIQTEVPQDNYSMGGFTLVYQDDYNSSGEGGEIRIYGYWNPESNSGFNGFRYECSNPYHTPTIEVCRNSSSGNTAFFISGEGGNYTQLIAKDLWLGYSASSATQQWGNGWVISQANNKDGYANFDTLNRNDFAAITTNGSTPSLTGGVDAAEIRTLIGAQVAGSYLTAHPSITEAADVNNSGGTVIQDLTFDDNGHVTATGSVNLDNIYTSTDGTEADYRFGLNLGNFTGTRWYKVATVNVGSGGLRIRGMMTNHVESFGSNMIDLAIQGREGNNNNEIEVTGHVHVLHENAGIAIYSGEKPGSYTHWDVYVVATQYTQCQLDLTKVSGSFDTSGNYVTTEPSGTLELETYQLAEGNYVIRDSAAKRIFDAGINLAGGLSYTPSTNTLTQTDNNTEYSVATTSANGLMSSTDKSKLDGIESGAEVNVQADWNETTTTSDAYINNKPTLGTAAASAATDFISATNADTAAELITFSKGISTDGHSKFYNWRALNNSSNSGNSYWKIAEISGADQSSRFIVTLAGRSTSYSDNALPAMGHIVGQLNNDNNWDLVFYNHSTASSEVVTEVAIVDDGTLGVELWIKTGNYAEITASGHISDGSFTVVSNVASDGFTESPDGYTVITEYTVMNTGNSDVLYKSGGTMSGDILLGTNSIAADTTSPTAHIQVGAGTTNTSNRSDVALLGEASSGAVVNALGLINTATGGNSNGVALNFHNGDGWSPTGQIIVQQDSTGTATNSAMKFYTFAGGLNHRMSIKSDGTIRFNAYGAGLIASDANGNLSVDTNTYLTGIAANSVGIAELNVSDGSEGQVLTTDGNGTLSFSTVSAGGSNYYLDGITRTSGTNTLVFSVSGATNQSYTFGANAFTSYTDHSTQGYLTEETYTAHEDTSNLSGTYGSTANGTKIDEITVYVNLHITSITTGATGNMTVFFVEDGDGTEVQINNSNEWKFVEGGGIDINWSDTSTGSDADPYDLTFTLDSDLRGDVVYIGGNANNYIQFDTTNNRIDFYAGGTFVARMESDGDLHIKGDVIAFSDIFG